MTSIERDRILQELERVERQWRTLRLLETLALWMAAGVTALLILGGLAVCGWFGSPAAFMAMALLLTLPVVAGSLLHGLLVLLVPLDGQLAVSAAERSRRNLMDRLHTLWHLDRSAPQSPWIAPIVRQAASALRSGPSARPFSWRRAVCRWAVCAGLLLVTALFYSWAQPYQKLKALEQQRRQAEQSQYQPFTLPENVPVQPASLAPFVEVRFVRPAADVRSLPWEEIPLWGEALASEPIEAINWYSSLRGTSFVRHPLPRSEDPQFVQWQTALDLIRLQAQSWDALAYFAQVRTESGKEATTRLYFVDVVPLTEDLERLPGGSQGPVAELLARLDRLTDSQQQAVQLVFDRLRDDPRVSEDWPLLRPALENLEWQLEQSLRLLESELAAYGPPGEVPQWQGLMEAWKQAETHLSGAAESVRQLDALEGNTSLADNLVNQPVWEAYHELCRLRKQLYDTIVAHPDWFLPDSPATPPDPWAPPSSRQLAEWHRAVSGWRSRQEALLEKLPPEPSDSGPLMPVLQNEQRRIRDEFAEWRTKLGQEASQMEPLLARSGESLDAAVDSLSGGEHGAEQDAGPRAQRRAAEQLRRLEQILQWAHARKLQQELEDLARQWDEVQQTAQRLDATEERPLSELVDAKTTYNDRLDFTRQYADSSLPEDAATRVEVHATDTQRARQRVDLLDTLPRDEQDEALRQMGRSAERLAEAARRDARRASIDARHLDLERRLAENAEQSSVPFQEARQQLQRLLTDQRQLQRDHARPQYEAARARQRQRELLEQFHKWQERFQSIAQSAAGQCQTVSRSMAAAENALAEQGSDRTNRERANDLIRQAGDSLQQLDSFLENQQRTLQPGQRRALGEAMQELAQEMEDASSDPDYHDSAQRERAADLAREMARQLESLEPEPPEARQNAEQIRREADQFQQADSESQRCNSAGRLAQRLKQSGDGLCKSTSGGPEGGAVAGDGSPTGGDSQHTANRAGRSQQPLSSSRTAGSSGRAGPSGSRSPNGSGSATGPNGMLVAHEQLSRAFRLLEMLARENAAQPRLTPDQRQRVRQEAWRSLQSALPALYGQNSSTQTVLDQLRQQFAEERAPLDMATVENLMRQVEQLRRETSQKSAPVRPETGVAVDPASVPPEYRDAVRRYFERLAGASSD
ncbi:MAG: hypothetical protein KatS3mg110_1493 [Pirellulaceae bacterium]|nr:MAG: hypothetical protein KatS3mg110_1493 [Pirellulaceae bacterium]